jgi:hypothetical protein
VSDRAARAADASRALREPAGATDRPRRCAPPPLPPAAPHAAHAHPGGIGVGAGGQARGAGGREAGGAAGGGRRGGARGGGGAQHHRGRWFRERARVGVTNGGFVRSGVVDRLALAKLAARAPIKGPRRARRALTRDATSGASTRCDRRPRAGRPFGRRACGKGACITATNVSAGCAARPAAVLLPRGGWCVRGSRPPGPATTKAAAVVFP